jgi:hypothetical protein
MTPSAPARHDITCQRWGLPSQLSVLRDAAVEGIPGWFLFAVLVIYGLMGLSLLPALAAIGFLLARRPQQALTLFATALLCEAVAWAAFCFLIFGMWDLRGMGLCLILLLAGAGQFLAALRSPRTYAVALGFAAGAVVVRVAGTSIGYGVLVGWCNMPPEWWGLLGEWHDLRVAVISLPLAVASLMIAVFLPFRSRQPESAPRRR